MGTVLSDAEMAALEAQHAPAAPSSGKKILSDDDMAALEQQHAQPTAVPSGMYRDTVDGVQGETKPLPKPAESFKDTVDRLTKNNNLEVTPQNVEQNLASLLAPGVSSIGGKTLAGAAARTVANAGVGAATDKEHPVRGAAMGGLLSGLGEATGAAAGKAGDWLMQKAVGMKKYMPGVGTTIADNGVWGTRAGMADDVNAALGKHNAALDDAVGRINGPIDSSNVAAKVGEHINDYKTGAFEPASTAAERDAVRARATDIANRGQVSPPDALGLKRLAGNEGYNAGRPLANLDSKLAQTESGAYGDELKDAYGRTYPGEENAVASANENMSALMKAKRPLTDPETLRKGWPLSTMFGAGMGAGVGGPVGGAIGAAAAGAARSPLVQSVGAQALVKGSPVLKKATPYLLEALSNKQHPTQE